MDLTKLTTESRNKETMTIDQLSTAEMVAVMNQEDQKVALAVEKELPQIAKAIDAVSEKFMAGGRMIYCGAGTSGRLGALDAIELTPTYSVSPKRAFGLIAGGKEAMFSAVEGAEDSEELAIEDLKKVDLTAADIVIAVAASGRTPYAISALKYGNEVDALTISVTCNGASEMNQLAQIGIAPIVGPEVITGSTRMKAGSAQKMVLNMLSTGVMIRSGKVFSNLMVNVQPTNLKLVKRAQGIIAQATDVSEEKALEMLELAEMDVAVAIVMIQTGLDPLAAKKAVKEHQGMVTQVIQAYQAGE
ncbi:N-acetylmuramic acid 6-phosphate etherase [Isobaculum melis]|uniref:N-acetylmuramic acid 6-phosphate etherase n=1 Tax=Isobaculum melis TaxID=142588 RepID=A0A1H9PNI0_9LACT|nr:N-acetylmuramic acid 6-phosphate etherase [Isobaculum melis]SER49728.1 N-acetylmuramic acid 6-phosphate etherase [Isobaculum melis]